MLKWLMRNRINAFERKLGYDMSYVREILDTDPAALWAFMKAAKIGEYRRGIPRDPLWGAKLTAIVREDCGPCTQLAVTLALAEGVSPQLLTALLADDLAAIPEPVALVVRYTRAVIARYPEADVARQEITARWGARAILSIAFAITAAHLYPTVKYAMGYGKTCQRVTVAGTPIAVVRAPAEVAAPAAARALA
jgi:hypothetical protein